ncbi:MAG: hypothetical protein ACOC7J_05465, partial [Armatimonadota bacterium]
SEVFIVHIDPPPDGVADDRETIDFAKAVAKLLFQQTQDVWDLIAVYADYGSPHMGSRYIRARNDTTRIGFDLWDGTEAFGSAGRLMGVGLIDDVNGVPQPWELADGDMQLLLHETIGHQYGVYHPEIRKRGSHFANGLESPSFTMMYGRPWQCIDDTHFRCEQQPNPDTGILDITFHPWILYIMGLKQRREVPARLRLIALDELPGARYSQYETTGTFEWVTMTDLFGPPTAADIPRPPLSLASDRGILVAPDPTDTSEMIRMMQPSDTLRPRRNLPRVEPMAPH